MHVNPSARAARIARHLTLLAVACCTRMPAPAQMPFGPPPSGPDTAGLAPPIMPFLQDPLFATLDGDADGNVTPEEWAAAFAKLDQDGNDAITPDEWSPRPDFGAFGGPGGPGGPGGFGGFGGFGGPGMPGSKRAVVAEFDADGDGRLDTEERAKARAQLRENPGRMGPPMRGPGGRRPGESQPAPKGERVGPDDVTFYPDRPLYDPEIIRTLFLEFPREDWEAELEDFHNTDVDLPADLTVDGKPYPGVGVRFRGNTSYMGIPSGMKRPLNLSIDYTIDGQDLYGYRTLNLLNANDDPSFLREFLFYWISRNYLPSLKVNFVKLVINGENWGLYVNSQQFNKDFIDEWYDDTGGVRWKVPANLSGGSSLQYYGDDTGRYKNLFELKTKDEEPTWDALVSLCRTLDQTEPDAVEQELARIVDIDEALWFLAIDNILMDDDGYFTRGSDFHMYQDAQYGRFHFFSHDNNETFRLGMGPPGMGGPGMGRPGMMGPPNMGAPGMGPGPGRPGMGPGVGRRDMSADAGAETAAPQAAMPGPDAARATRRGGRPGGGPPTGGGGESQGGWTATAGADNEARPLLRCLLASPALKSRYLAHYRAILDESFSWEALGPVVEHYRQLLADEMRRDVKRRTSLEAFLGTQSEIAPQQADGPPAGPGFMRSPFPGMMRGAPDLREFIETRRAFLLRQPELAAPAPRIASVALVSRGEERAATTAALPVGADARVVVRLDASAPPAQGVYLHWARERHAPFTALPLAAEGDTHTAALPNIEPGECLFFYVEARAAAGAPSHFAPARAEFEPFQAAIPPQVAAGGTSPVLVTELMPSNARTLADSQGEFDDWIELANVTGEEVDVGGWFLSDDPAVPRKWHFPAGITIPPGATLLVWADEDRGDGLHASFKLSAGGETLVLSAVRDDALVILDRVEFPALAADQAFGRTRKGDLARLVAPTPGRPNGQ